MRWKCKIITTHRPTLPDEYAACAVLESGVVDCPAETTAWYGTEKEAMDALEGELSGHFWWETKEAK